MPLRENRFKNWCRTALPEGPPIGTWLMASSSAAAELIGYIGYDWAVIDMEHSPIDYHQMLDMLRAVSLTSMQPIVRIPWNDKVMAKRALDAGAPTLMFPFVQNADEARAAVEATKYPPHGVRGFAGMHRGCHYATEDVSPEEMNDHIAVVLQLETPQAVAQMAEIAAVPDVDALFIGPADLAAAMGHTGDVEHQAVQEALKAGAQHAQNLGKPLGIVGGTADQAQRYLDYGFTYVAVQSDLAMLAAKAKENLAALKADIKVSGASAAY